MMAFIGVKDPKIVVRNDMVRLKWITYGFIAYVKENGFRGPIKLLVKGLRRRFHSMSHKHLMIESR